MGEKTARQGSSASQLMDMIFGFILSRAVSLAAQLGVADQLKAGPKSVEELASALGVHPQALYRMLRALAGAGVFSELDGRRFQLSPISELLRSDHPESLRAFAEMLANAISFETWSQLPHPVRTGEPAFPHKFGMPWFAWLAQHPDEARVFHDAMTSLSASALAAVVTAYDFTGIRKLVDVGGGHGFLLASVLAKYPKMTGVLFDDPQVVAGAAAVLKARGVAERCEVVGGDFFRSVPAGGDAYILKHIIHDWSDDECRTILDLCRNGMPAGGKVLIVEMVVPGPNAPSLSKLLDLVMLVFLTGRERTADEYRTLLDRSGFELTRIAATASPYCVIEGVKR